MSDQSGSQFIQQTVEFLGEQDGVPERRLKAELRRSFEATVVQRAYLALVRYSADGASGVALCLVAKSGHESQLVPMIELTFSRMFNRDEHLDIMFLDEQQESRVSGVCRPFFVRSEAVTEARQPDFVLVSSEGYGLESPRKCWSLRPVRLPTRDDLLLVKVEPPIVYDDCTTGDPQLGEVVLAARHAGYSINAIEEWPFYVHVAKLNRPDVPADGLLRPGDVCTIAWAELYPDETALIGRTPA